MGSPRSFSCVLIGAESLLVECGEILLQQGHTIRGVISGTPRIADWALEHGLDLFDPDADYTADLAAKPFDFLFAITHLAKLPDEVLSLPQDRAINFHDGMLPRYAGLHTPAWALMNGETTYGITWHEMTSRVDGGDILKQASFDIDPDETSLTLNTKCFEAGMTTFDELVSELATDVTTPKAQDTSTRLYFGKYKRPAAACALDWNRPAEALEAMIRALDFGRYDNPLGSAKLARGGAVFIVTQAKANPDDRTNEPPGTITRTNGNVVCVAAGIGTLSITALSTVYGKALTPEAFTTRLNLKPGDSFDVLDATSTECLTELNAKLCKSEAFWVDRLAGLEQVELPYGGNHPDTPSRDGATDVTVEIAPAFRDRYRSECCADAIVAAFAAFLTRIGDTGRFDLGFADPALRKHVADFEAWVEPWTPLSIDLEAGDSFLAAQTKVTASLGDVRSRPGLLRDAIARHTALSANPNAIEGRLFPICVEIRDRFEDATDASASGLTLLVAADGSACRFRYDTRHFSETDAASLASQFGLFLADVATDADARITSVDLLSADERTTVLDKWNATSVPYRNDACIHELFEAQAERTPDAIAAVFQNESYTYRELNERANQLAAQLRELGIGPDCLVGIFVERSLDLVVATLGTLKSGGAYVPLDPAFPEDRIAYMIENSSAGVIIAQDHLIPHLPHHGAPVVRIDADWPTLSQHPTDNRRSDVRSSNLAYVIYTSGSTGQPKGVMVEHRNAVNFFVGMDERVDHDPPGVWLAVTSLSFDISVLELLWTLSRGFKVVIAAEQAKSNESVGVQGNMNFGLFFWGNDDGPGASKYRLLLESAKFADEHGFSSVSTPERHFHAFGGPYPNPSVTGAAIAAVTTRIQVRSGSTVIPLHHPLRIAEEWAVVDNLSNGRVAVGCAAGWQPHDFVLRPENYPDNKAKMFEYIEIVRRLWRGESIAFPGPGGEMVDRTSLPRPVQAELPIWMTIAGNPETYRQAGELGFNVLTHLLGQSVEEVAEKIKIYRDALEASGRDPSSGCVTLMLHTFVGDNDDDVRELVRKPMKDYLGSSVALVKQFAWVFPAFKKPGGPDSTPDHIDLDALSAEEVDAILEFAFERYFDTSGLFGTPERCLGMVDKLKGIGVDEIACLIDFGVPAPMILKNLPQLNRVRELSNPAGSAQHDTGEQYSIADELRRHKITHMQCTPSMAAMLLMDDDARDALSGLQTWLIGGEALPPSLASRVAQSTKAKIVNMYGPTETTVWSSTEPVTGAESSISIGRPIANTQLYILDKHQNPAAPGVPGELCIGGDGVVRGYYNQPELTKERFISNPFSKDPSARIYRTGDLAKFLPDGRIDFLGRIDYQVKIRGYRIELGEIESLLCGCPGIRDAVVIVREDSQDDKRLVAYIIAEPGASTAEKTLRDLLRKKLPDYMVPSHFVSLESFPKTPNRKVDRKALPAPNQQKPTKSSTPVAAANDIEGTIIEIWKDILGTEHVGAEDNFFDLGGHSLLAVATHRRLKKAFSKKISITDLFRFPNVRALANFVGEEANGAALASSQQRGSSRRAAMARRRQVRSRRSDS